MSIAKVALRFDVLPEEKEELERICRELGGIDKIAFLRKSMGSSVDMYEALKLCEDYLCKLWSVDTQLLGIVHDAMNKWEGKK